MKFARNVVCMALCGIMSLGMVPTAHAANAADIYINGELFTYDTVKYGEVTVYQNRLYVPLRILSERLGYEVGFVDGNKATVENGPLGRVVVDLSNLDSKSFAVGTETVTLDVPVARLAGNRTMIAARGFANALNCEVTWDGAAHITTGTVEPPMADSDNGIKNVISAKEFDPSKLEKSNALAKDIVSEWKKTPGNDAASGVTNDETETGLILQIPGQPIVDIAVSHNGDGIQISGGAYQYPAFWKVARQFYVSALSETVSSEIQTNVMKMLDDLAKRFTANESNARTWYLENVSNKGFPVSDGYILTFGDTGLCIRQTDTVDPSVLRPSYPFDK